MEIYKKSTIKKGNVEKLIAESVRKGLSNALKERAKPKVTKISSTQLAEGIRKAVKKIIKEMHATDVVGWHSEGVVFCSDHMKQDEAEELGFQPIFVSNEGWEDMVCDEEDKEYAKLAGNRFGVHTLGQVAGLSENKKIIKEMRIPAGDTSALWDWMNGEDSVHDSLRLSKAYQKGGVPLLAKLMSRLPVVADWSEEELLHSLGDMEAQDLLHSQLGGGMMESKKTTKKDLNQLVVEAVRKGLSQAVKARSPKPTKITSVQLAEGIRKAVKKVLKEMHATDIVGWAGEGYVVCPDHISEKEAEAKGMNPVFATEEGWEDMTCDVHDKEYAELAGNRLGIHTLGQVAGISENTMVSPTRAGSGQLSGGAMPPPGKGAVAGTAAPTMEAVDDMHGKGIPASFKRSSSTFGQIPSPEELQQAIDDLNGWDMELKGSDAEAFDIAMNVAGINTHKAINLMQTGEGMHKVLSALVNLGNEPIDELEDSSEVVQTAESLASSIMSVLGWEWL